VSNAQITENSLPFFGSESGDFQYNQDFAIGINYKFSPIFVAKLETHWNKGFTAEDVFRRYLADDPVTTQYSIISFSANF